VVNVDRLKGALPAGIRRRLRPLARGVRGLRGWFAKTTSGEAVALYARDGKPLGLVDAWRVARLLRESGPRPGLVAISPRALHGASVLLRPGSSDAGVAVQAFVHGYHVPPFDLGSPQVVWDLGANIGLTVAHYACLYPRARIVGVEPDPDNAALAARNIQRWRDRCTILEYAVWDSDVDVAFAREPGQEFAARVVQPDSPTPDERRVAARSLTTLLEGESTVDLLKVDIEGAERTVLTSHTEWAAKVRHIIVEVHEPYTVDECVHDLERLGFRTSINPRFWVSIVGTKAPD
jgi:FkbM family methyltransferase